DGGTATDETRTESETTTATETEATPTEDEVTAPEDGDGLLARVLGWALVALLAAAALAIMPVTAVLARRRERAAAVDGTARVEQEGRDLIDRLEALGVEPPVGATPRDGGDWVGPRAHPEGEARGQLDHVVTTLERARYGRPGQELPDVSSDVSAVVGEVRGQRMRSARLRAALWPRAGVDAWAAVPRRVGAALRRLTRR